MIRGTAWFALYLLLVLVPLLVAWQASPFAGPRPFVLELGVALGWVGLAIISLEFALVSRLRASSKPFGTDVLMLFHRYMGVSALAFGALHALALAAFGGTSRIWSSSSNTLTGASGAIALASALALVTVSLGRRRLRLRYELWRRTHALLALLVMGSMLVHAVAASGYSRSPIVKTVLLIYGALFIVLMLLYRLVRPLLLWRKPWELVANRCEGGDTRTLVLRPAGHGGIEFDAGQFAWLVTGRSPFSAEQHPITISSSAEPAADRSIELTIKALGDWSREVVPSLMPGSLAWIDGPFGAFTLDRLPGLGFVMIAGGIGITPMRSMLLTMRDREDLRPVLLFHAARNSDRAVFLDELRGLELGSNLRVIPVFEEPAPGWQGERGLVTAEILQRHLPPRYTLWQFLICGPAPMLDALEGTLIELRVPPERIQTERFDLL